MKTLAVVLCAVTFSLITSNTRAQDFDPYDQSKIPLEVEPTDPKLPKIVLIAGSRSHGPGDHEFFAGTALLMKMLSQNGVAPVMARDGWPKNEKIFDGAKAVVIYSDGDGGHPAVQGKRPELLNALMKNGVGFGFMHYGVHAPKARSAEFLDWIGGHYESDYSVNPMWTPNFDTFPDHPIARGVQPFAVKDEWYFNLRFRPDMKGITPILVAKPSDKVRDGPYVWPAGPFPHVQAAKGREETMMWAAEREGGGRGFGFTGGHVHNNWTNDNFRRVVTNAILWIAKVEVPKDGAKVEMDATDIKRNMDDKRPKK